MKITEKKNIHEYFPQQAALWYKLVVLFFAFSYIIDIFSHLHSLPKTLFWADIITLVLTFVSLILFIKKIITQKISFLIIIYSGIITLFVSYYYLLSIKSFSYGNILQDLITIPVIILSVGFLAGKRYMFIIGVVLAVLYPLFMSLADNKILNESAFFVAVMIVGATLASFIVTITLENAMKLKDETAIKLHEQNEKLVKLNEERSRLFAIIAHDLKNPIGNAVNLGSFLNEEDLSESERKELLFTLYKTNKKAYELLDDLLNWAKEEQGLFAYNPEIIVLRSVVDSVISLMETKIKEKSITVFNNIKNDITVFSDKMILETVLRNLLSNALKYTFPNGEIVFDAYDTGETVTFTITDNGMGMSEERITKLFSEDIISSKHGTNNEKGNGLGLKLVKNLLDKNKSSISVVSTEGKGTTFTVAIPKREV